MTIRRMKTYTGSQGYVYQYYFVGQRPAGDATEFIFDVSSDRKHSFAVSIVLPTAVVAGWNQEHGRSLTGTEQYAAVKMRLFRVFDEVADLQNQARTFQIDPVALQEGLNALDIK